MQIPNILLSDTILLIHPAFHYLSVIMFLSATWLYCIDVSVSLYRSSHNSVWLCFCRRFLTFCYLAAFNCWLLLCPATLSHDWQMGSVPLLTTLTDSRNIATCLFFGCCFLIAYRGIADFEVSSKHVILDILAGTAIIAYRLRHYDTSRKVTSSRPDKVNEFFQFSNLSGRIRLRGSLSLWQKWVPEA
jgi:hypothetical protein